MKTIIRDIREELELTNDEFATILGISLSGLYQLEAGSPKNITDNALQALDRLGYDIEFIKQQYQKDRKAKAEELFKRVE